jgi:hypothetical protein
VQRGRADSEVTNKKFTEGLTAAQADELRSTIRTMLANAKQSIADN